MAAGRMAERTKATVLKTVSGATRSRVRIPVLPQAAAAGPPHASPPATGCQRRDRGASMFPKMASMRALGSGSRVRTRSSEWFLGVREAPASRRAQQPFSMSPVEPIGWLALPTVHRPEPEGAGPTPKSSLWPVPEFGLRTTFQVPFVKWAISVRRTKLLVSRSPTAQALVAEIALMSLKKLILSVPTLGLGTTSQPEPVFRRVRVWRMDVPVPLPAAH